MNSMSQNNAQPMTFWTIWLSIFTGVFFIIFFLEGEIPSGVDQEPRPLKMMTLSCLGVFFGTLIRWVWLPKITTLKNKMTPFVIGLALCEITIFCGIFLIGKEFPQTKLVIFTAGILGVLQFAPTFSRSKFQANDPFHS